MVRPTVMHGVSSRFAQVGDVTPIFREIAAPTTTLAEITLDLPVFGSNVVYQIERIIHSSEEAEVNSEPTPAATADEFDVARARFCLSLDQGLAAIPTGYRRNRTFWYKNVDLFFAKGNAASQTALERRQGMPDIYVPYPHLLVADNRVSLYTILEDPDSLVGIVGKVSVIELLVRPIAATAEQVMAIARAGDGFI